MKEKLLILLSMLLIVMFFTQNVFAACCWTTGESPECDLSCSEKWGCAGGGWCWTGTSAVDENCEDGNDYATCLEYNYTECWIYYDCDTGEPVGSATYADGTQVTYSEECGAN